MRISDWSSDVCSSDLLPDNNVILAILIHVHDQNRDAGSAKLKFEVRLPFPVQWIFRSFQPAIGKHKITTAIPVYIAKTQSMALIVGNPDRLELSGWFP